MSKSKAHEMVSAAGEFLSDAAKGAADAASQAGGAVTDAASKAADGITKGASDVAKAASTTMDAAKDNFEKHLGKLANAFPDGTPCEPVIDEETALGEIRRHSVKAEELLKDKNRTEAYLLRMEKKVKAVPIVGGPLSVVPVLISLVRSWVRKEYTLVPAATIVAALAALLYFLSPVDLIPDTIPGIGYVDDAAVLAVCWSLVSTDVEQYKEWLAARNV